MSRPEHYQLNRRNFIARLGAGLGASLGAGLAASAFAPQLLLSAEAGRRAEEPLILGAGAHRYEWVRGWGKLPTGMEFGATHGAVQVDAKGLIYFNTDTENAIISSDTSDTPRAPQSPRIPNNIKILYQILILTSIYLAVIGG
ncbi:MAG: hypothetical protein AAB401_17060, partial [Acidobacteriota bacterium]